MCIYVFVCLCVLCIRITFKNQGPNLKGFEKHRKSERKKGKDRNDLNVTLIY